MSETISIQVPDGGGARIVAALCDLYDYPNNKLAGETQASFTRRYTRAWWRTAVLNATVKSAETAIRTDTTDPFVTDTIV